MAYLLSPFKFAPCISWRRALEIKLSTKCQASSQRAFAVQDFPSSESHGKPRKYDQIRNSQKWVFSGMRVELSSAVSEVCSALGLSLDLWNLRKLTQRAQPMLKADSITPDSLLSTCIGQARCMSLKMLDEFSLELWRWMTVTTPVTCQYSEVKHLGSLLDHI